MSGMRDDFTADVKRILVARVGNRCSNPDCRRPTIGPQTDPAKYVNIGVAAHITAAASGGPRFDPALSPHERRSVHNGIWLCQSCAKLIDSDDQKYPISLLREWKKTAEFAAEQELLRFENLAPLESTEPDEEMIVRAWWQMADDLVDALLPWEFDIATSVETIDAAWWEFLGRRAHMMSGKVITTPFRQYIFTVTSEPLRSGYTRYLVSIKGANDRQILIGEVFLRGLAGSHTRLLVRSTPVPLWSRLENVAPDRQHEPYYQELRQQFEIHQVRYQEWQRGILYHLVKTFLIWLAFDQGMHINRVAQSKPK